ncbi:hypothetical protein JB92DRAFT_3130948 [Gautieria morchelliformis]|nr:hypothetical protein JB92DRAFT_3130948 [Gautieria morchelliformis]
MSDEGTSNRAAPVLPDDVYNKAFGEAVGSLPKESKAFLLSTRLEHDYTPTHILDGVARYCEQQARKNRLLKYARKFRTVIEPLERFFVVIDQRVAGNLGPGIVWSCLRFVITVVCDFARYFEKITDAFEKITLKLPVYNMYANWPYSEAAGVHEALVNVYSHIFNVCIAVLHIFKNKKGADRPKFMIYVRALDPRKTALDKVVREFDRQHGKLENVIEAARTRIGSRRDQEMKRDNVIVPDLLADYAPQHAMCRTMIGQDASGQWLLLRPEYREWVSATWNAGTALLWMAGRAGVGKTILASTVIENLTRIKDSRTALAYFYCRHDDGKNCSSHVLISTLLYQLTLQIPLASSYFPIFNGPDQMVSAFEETIALLLRFVFGSIYLVIDGLDELDTWSGIDSNERAPILLLLNRLASVQGLRLLVTGRRKTEIITALGQPTIDISEDDTKDDIDNYIRNRVRLARPGAGASWIGYVLVTEVALRDDIVTALKEGARGMFRWVYLQILTISRQETVRDIRGALAGFPQELGRFYNRSLQAMDTLDDTRRERAYRTIRWVAYAQGPLTLPALAEAAVIDEMPGNQWDASCLIADRWMLIGDCADLLVYEPSRVAGHEGRVVLAHPSVEQFLASPRVAVARQLHLLAANSMLATSILKYLSLLSATGQDCDFEEHPLTGYLGTHWASHFGDIEGGTVGQALNNFSPQIRQLLGV